MDHSAPERARHRVPLSGKVSLKFKEFRGFINEVSANISLGGMFIVTDDPKPLGTVFDFEMGLEDEFTLLQGIGQVAWVRDGSAADDQPPGMGIRFLELSPGSRALVERIVDEHIKEGGEPFDPDTATAEGAVETKGAMEGADAAPEEGGPSDERHPLSTFGDPPMMAASPLDEDSAAADPGAVAASPVRYPLLGSGHLSRGRVVWPHAGAAEEVPPGAGAEAAAEADAAATDLAPAATDEAPARAAGAGRREVPPGFDEVARTFAETGAHRLSERPAPLPSPADLPEPATGVASQVGPPPVARPPRRPSRGRGFLIVALLLVAGLVTVAVVAPGQLRRLGLPIPWGEREVREAEAPGPEAGEPAVTVTGEEPAPVAAPPPAEPEIALEEESPIAADLPLTRVADIRWELRGTSTVVTIEGDGGFGPATFSRSRIGGPRPRELIRIRGIEDAVDLPAKEVGTAHLTRIRTGYHEVPGGNELHIVLDLPAAEIEPTAIEPQGTQLVIVLAEGS